MNLTCVNCEKPLIDDHQALTGCRCDLADQNLEPSEAFDSLEPVINPKPAPYFEKSKQIPSRFVFCKNYDLCLNFAIARYWNSFTCEECNDYEAVKCSSLKWLHDNSRCLELIDALEKVERVSE